MQRPLPDIECITGFDNFEIPVAFIMRLQAFDAIRRSDHGCVGNGLHEPGQPTRMIHFDMIGNQTFDFCRIDQFRDSRQHFIIEVMLNRIDQRDFVIENQVRIIS